MTRRPVRTSTARSDSSWLMLLLLVAAIAVPTVCVLWFMSEAMGNERLAARQKLTSVYQSQLDAVERRLRSHCEKKQAALDAIDLQMPAPEIFEALVTTGLAESAVVYDAAGNVAYPVAGRPRPHAGVAESAAWSTARRLEFERDDPAGAAIEYARIAADAQSEHLAAAALLARARCLSKSGDSDSAIALLTNELAHDRYRASADAQGRLIAPDASLFALQLIGEPSDARFRRVAEMLWAQLADYGNVHMPAGQRAFLMARLESEAPGSPAFPTLEAEKLAARQIEANRQIPSGAPLQRSGVPGVWQLRAASGRFLALYKEENIIGEVGSLVAAQGLPSDVEVEAVPPQTAPSRPGALISLPLGDTLDGWRLVLHAGDSSLVEAAADRQIVSYLWTGVLVVAAFVFVAILGAGVIRRQLMLAGLKNDLVASVSHELKTPLSSMRMLVDTLLDDVHFDEQKVREYLQLIAKENARLSHLIDSFLTFSRMQRSKPSFEMPAVEPAEIACTAVEAVGEKFQSERCHLDVEMDADLPKIAADSDALVTVVMNLLDNACKYSGDEKRIRLRVRAADGTVRFEVQDNGIGLSRRAAKRVFDRFYQADQRLSRAVGGCGLGLSIVQSIVEAHGGKVDVESEPDRGSTFTVRIPIADSRTNHVAGVSGT